MSNAAFAEVENRKQSIGSLQQSFAENGYLIFRKVVPKERLTALAADLREEFDRARGSSALFSGGGLISGHVNSFPGEGARFAYEALEQHGIVDVIRAIYPKPFAGPYVGCNLNLPGSVAQHYHMDGWFLGDFIIANVAVVDTDLVNGAIDVLPGTHKSFYPYWRFVLERARRLTTRVQMQQGDVLIRTSRLWHRGMPNRAAVPRPMIGFTLGDPATTPAADPFRVNDGKIVFQPNWFRTTALGRLREHTFAAAPVTYSAYRFVRSLFGNKGYAAW